MSLLKESETEGFRCYGVVTLAKFDGIWHSLMVHSNKGHWGFPKGKIEKKKYGETKVQCAFRELFEETGCKENNITL